ncbi:hypothetical protein CSKR_101287 [Clonorchis sinensis]|uniref:Uncharacterized protein n=1 Tax=Clonorchis sinensis TaxID=79923 RepID=A0A3R7CQ35_CLOSI|nr:hypothetical protein CSKR_101287 [Clonorchis sinensis]
MRMEREFTDRKVRGSNPTSASRLPLSRLGQPDSIPALVLPSGGMAARHRKGVTAERLLFIITSSCGKSYSVTNQMVQWLERESTDRKVRGSNPTSASRLPLSRLGQPDSIPALVLPSGGIALRHRKGATAERVLPASTVPSSPYFCFRLHSHVVLSRIVSRSTFPKPNLDHYRTNVYGGEMDLWLESEFIDRKVRDSNPNSASRFPLFSLGQPGSIPALVLPSGGMTARSRKGVTTERFFKENLRGSNPNPASRRPLSSLEQLDGISALVLPSSDTTSMHRKTFTAERLFV